MTITLLFDKTASFNNGISKNTSHKVEWISLERLFIEILLRNFEHKLVHKCELKNLVTISMLIDVIVLIFSVVEELLCFEWLVSYCLTWLQWWTIIYFITLVVWILIGMLLIRIIASKCSTRVTITLLAYSNNRYIFQIKSMRFW